MTTEDIRDVIAAAIPAATILVEDPMNDGRHFQAVVVSPDFRGLPPVERHRRVLKALREAFQEEVHSLGLKTFTPEDWERARRSEKNRK